MAIICQSSANVNQTITCTLTAQKSIPIGSLIISVDFGDKTFSNLTFISFTSSYTINKSYNTSGYYILTANILEYFLDVNCIIESRNNIFKYKSIKMWSNVCILVNDLITTQGPTTQTTEITTLEPTSSTTITTTYSSTYVTTYLTTHLTTFSISTSSTYRNYKIFNRISDNIIMFNSLKDFFFKKSFI